MNVFKIFRLSLWSLLLAGCLTIGGLYFAVHKTFLTQDGLTEIVKESELSATVRSEVLLPKILQTTRASDYAVLLDDKTVTDAFNTAVSTEVLDAKLQPAVDSIRKWLNSEEPKIDFSIEMTDLSDKFATTLAKEANEKIATLPRCVARNTSADALNGICKSSLVSTESLSEKIRAMIVRDASLAENTTITPASIPLSSSIIQSAGSDLPSYLNMLYAGALVSAGIALLASLWLLFKHRLAGIVAIGAAGVLGGISLYIVGIIAAQAGGTVSSDTQVQQVARAGTGAFELVMQQQALLLCAFGAALIAIAVIILLILKNRNKTKQSMHLGS